MAVDSRARCVTVATETVVGVTQLDQRDELSRIATDQMSIAVKAISNGQATLAHYENVYYCHVYENPEIHETFEDIMRIVTAHPPVHGTCGLQSVPIRSDAASAYQDAPTARDHRTASTGIDYAGLQASMLPYLSTLANTVFFTPNAKLVLTGRRSTILDDAGVRDAIRNLEDRDDAQLLMAIEAYFPGIADLQASVPLLYVECYWTHVRVPEARPDVEERMRAAYGPPNASYTLTLCLDNRFVRRVPFNNGQEYNEFANHWHKYGVSFTTYCTL